MYETLISCEDLDNMAMDASVDVLVVDCRFAIANTAWGRSEYQKAHIPGAVYAHLDEDLSDPVVPGITGRHPLPDQERFLHWVEEKGIMPGTQVVAYDQGAGGYAARFWWLMRWIGHEHVAVLDGGFQQWEASGYPVDANQPAGRTHGQYPIVHKELTVDADCVGEWCAEEDHVVLDAREYVRYAGFVEPLDPIAGHIPGAVSLPFSENLTSQGTWRSAAELRERFSPIFDRVGNAAHVACYCGSGVTACHNILAIKHAGLGDVKLYPGSWSEWITNPERGVEVIQES